jgi:uncharacterized protein YbjT (DUF2867 family)
VLIAVIGATGKQGGGVIDALHESSHSLATRAVVRDARAPKATALKARVAQIVEADLDDVESLRAAFKGADGAYCVTPPDADDELGRETVRAQNMAAAARDARLEHVVWSTQEDTRSVLEAAGSGMPVFGNRFRVPSYDAKAEADAAFRAHGVPTTFMRTSFYWESLFLPHVGPTPTSDAGAAIRWPLGDAKLPGIAVGDIGRCAVGLFARRSTYFGRTVGVCGEQLTGFEIATALGEALHIDCRYEPIEPEEFCRLPFQSAAAIANMFQYKRDFAHVHARARDVALSRSLNPRLRTFRQWLAEKSPLPASKRLRDAVDRGAIGPDADRALEAERR